jgi:hypothetical protein
MSVTDDSQRRYERHNGSATHLDIVRIIGAERLRVRDAPAVGSRLASARAFSALALVPDGTAKHAFLERTGNGRRHEERDDKEEASEVNHSEGL